MNIQRAGLVTTSVLLAATAYSANPFLNSSDDKPVSAKFRGTEWGDNIDKGEIALTARVITTRIAQMDWGAIFKIEFVDLKSRAKKWREAIRRIRRTKASCFF